MFFERESMVKQDQMKDSLRQREMERLLHGAAPGRRSGRQLARSNRRGTAQRVLAGMGRLLFSGADAA